MDTRIMLTCEDADIVRAALIKLRRIEDAGKENGKKRYCRKHNIPYGPDIYRRIARNLYCQLTDKGYIISSDPAE